MGISRDHDVATQCVQCCCTLTHFSHRENSPTRSLWFYQVHLPFGLSSSSADLDKHQALCLRFFLHLTLYWWSKMTKWTVDKLEPPCLEVDRCQDLSVKSPRVISSLKCMLEINARWRYRGRTRSELQPTLFQVRRYSVNRTLKNVTSRQNSHCGTKKWGENTLSVFQEVE